MTEFSFFYDLNFILNQLLLVLFFVAEAGIVLVCSLILRKNEPRVLLN